jgi:Adenylylsulphate kinase
VENIRRITELAKLMVEAGLIASVSLISPFRSERHCPARPSRKKRSAVSDFSLNPSVSSWLRSFLNDARSMVSAS